MRKMKTITRRMIILGTVLCVGMFPCSAAAQGEVKEYTNTDFAMDTVVSETLYTTGEDINQDISEILTEVERQYLSWTEEGSEVYQINHSEGEPVQISDKLAGYLGKILEIADTTGGAFDPTMGNVIRLWDIRGENPQVPQEEELNSLLAETGYENLTVDGNEVVFNSSAALDLGAAGKGIGCDEVLEFLKEQKEVSGMLLNLGGSSVMTYGEKPDQTPWRVAVRDPRDTEGDYLGIINMEGGEFLSTSGDYEQYFMEDGKRYHHILDPETGYPVWNGLTAVTVICDNGLTADALSTACFVLGTEEAAGLLEKYGANALFVDEDHNIYMTDGMKERFELTKNTYTISDALKTDSF